MRWTVTAPVTWPSEQGWDVWWQGVLQEILGGLGATPGVREDVPGLFEVDGEHVRLVSGDHLRPGAVYRWVPPEGGVIGSAAWGIGGRTDRRDVYLEYQETADPRRSVVVQVDGFDACGSVRATSTLRHLTAEASFVPQRDQLLDVVVKLDWLLLQVRARVVPGERGEQLRVSLRVVGRGIWKPVVAPLLVPLGIALRHVLTEETEEVADRLTHLDEDPRGDGAPEREMERIREGAELIRERLHEVVRTVEARPWWKGRRAKHLRAAFAALPAVGTVWPPVTPALTFGDSGRWWDEEQWIFDTVVQSDPWRRRRHRAVDEQVDFWLRRQEDMVEVLARQRVELSTSAPPVAAPSYATAAEFNEMADLSWLATPWSTVRFIVRKGADPDEDLPPMETDEDARSFVSAMLKDL